MFCTQCGQENRITSKFCSRCGKPIKRREPSIETATPALPASTDMPDPSAATGTAAPIPYSPSAPLPTLPPLVQDDAPMDGGFGSIVEFRKIELTLLSDLESVLEYTRALNLDKSLQLITDVTARVKDRSFTVAVVGEFKRGKSTFVNALLGANILPADILPTTATLNRIQYGLKPEVWIQFKNGMRETIPPAQLSEYVTKLTQQARDRAETIEEAVIAYPIPFLQNNVEIIDTPGLNDEGNMSTVTYSVLPKVEAAILVISARAPFSQYEADFLENKLLTNDLAKVIFVVNMIDTLDTPQDQERIVQFIKQRIQENILNRAKEQYGQDSDAYKVYVRKIGEPKVFGVSSSMALKGKQQNDTAKFETSQFAAFESALEKFLTQDRGAIVLQVPINRLLVSAKEILDSIDLREKSVNMKNEDFKAIFDKTTAEIRAARQRKTEEFKRIDDTAASVKSALQPLIAELPNEMNQAADQVIDNTQIEPKDLKDERLKELHEKLSGEVSNALKNVNRRFADKIQQEIQKGLAAEAERLREFAQSLDETLTAASSEFESVQVDSSAKRSGTVEGVLAVVSVWTGLGGIWSGYRMGGAKGAAIGAGASLGTAVGAGLLLGVLAIPVTLPVLVVVGIVSFFTGGKLVEAVMGKQMVSNFREKYKDAIHQEIDKQWQAQGVEQRVYEQVNDAFQMLKNKVGEEVDALLDNTQNTLMDLRAKRERDETLTEQERYRLQLMRAETQRIQGRAQGLAKQIIEILSV